MSNLPQDVGFGSGKSCWRRMREWNVAGAWQRLHEVLLAELNAASGWTGPVAWSTPPASGP